MKVGYVGPIPYYDILKFQAVVDGKEVGYTSFSIKGKELYIELVSAKKEYRGKGIAFNTFMLAIAYSSCDIISTKGLSTSGRPFLENLEKKGFVKIIDDENTEVTRKGKLEADKMYQQLLKENVSPYVTEFQEFLLESRLNEILKWDSEKNANMRNMKHIKTFESFIYEANGKQVVFFPGRFQPFHNGHLEALRRTSQEFGLPVIPLQILSKNEESPFPDALLKKMGADLAKNNSFIADYFIYPQGYGKTVIPWFVRYLRDEGYDPMGLGCGSDRLKDYNNQVAYLTGPKSDTPVDPGFTVKMVDARDSDGASGTRVREALRNDDEKSFQSMMPRELWKYYDELKKYIK